LFTKDNQAIPAGKVVTMPIPISQATDKVLLVEKETKVNPMAVQIQIVIRVMEAVVLEGVVFLFQEDCKGEESAAGHRLKKTSIKMPKLPLTLKLMQLAKISAWPSNPEEQLQAIHL
jgi:hypothetical protein